MKGCAAHRVDYLRALDRPSVPRSPAWMLSQSAGGSHYPAPCELRAVPGRARAQSLARVDGAHTGERASGTAWTPSRIVSTMRTVRVLPTSSGWMIASATSSCAWCASAAPAVRFSRKPWRAWSAGK